MGSARAPEGTALCCPRPPFPSHLPPSPFFLTFLPDLTSPHHTSPHLTHSPAPRCAATHACLCATSAHGRCAQLKRRCSLTLPCSHNPNRLYYQLGNAVCPPIVGAVAAALADVTHPCAGVGSSARSWPSATAAALKLVLASMPAAAMDASNRTGEARGPSAAEQAWSGSTGAAATSRTERDGEEREGREGRGGRGGRGGEGRRGEGGEGGEWRREEPVACGGRCSTATYSCACACRALRPAKRVNALAPGLSFSDARRGAHHQSSNAMQCRRCA